MSVVTWSDATSEALARIKKAPKTSEQPLLSKQQKNSADKK